MAFMFRFGLGDVALMPTINPPSFYHALVRSMLFDSVHGRIVLAGDGKRIQGFSSAIAIQQLCWARPASETHMRSLPEEVLRLPR
jgi:hypothetical protein